MHTATFINKKVQQGLIVLKQKYKLAHKEPQRQKQRQKALEPQPAGKIKIGKLIVYPIT